MDIVAWSQGYGDQYERQSTRCAVFCARGANRQSRFARGQFLCVAAILGVSTELRNRLQHTRRNIFVPIKAPSVSALTLVGAPINLRPFVYAFKDRLGLSSTSLPNTRLLQIRWMLWFNNRVVVAQG